ncbi:MAG: hypothetical protein AAF152_14480 [Cyanobacteria bacterium P01_A01_bin.114]
MGTQNFNRLGQSALLLVGIASIVGCPQVTSSSQRVDETSAQPVLQNAVEPAFPVSSIALPAETIESASGEKGVDADFSGLSASQMPLAQMPSDGSSEGLSSEREIAYTVCSDLGNWQRPSDEDQAKQLQADARYEEALQEEPLKSLADSLWQHQVISFTTYGLSARVDPINLSGLWTVADDIWSDCYSGSEGEEINSGAMAEAWLMYHRVTGVRWQAGQYVIAVEPSEAGVQVVQFERLEAEETLPVLVMDASAQPVEVFSGDW